MYAVIATGGKQYRVAEGDVVRIEKLAAEPGATVEFDKVLLVGNGSDVKIGAPLVAGGKVSGVVAKHGKGDLARILKTAFDAVEQDEDHHLYHTQGWCRELWIQSLGFPAVLPPPEEVKQVETAIGASRAEQARGEML